MPSEATITQDLTFKAANEIAARGRVPTLELVRAQLAAWTNTKGGSFATLGPWLRLWKEQQRAAAAEPVREAVPAAVAERVAVLASDLWAVASETAMSRLAGEREAVSKARDEAEADTAEALQLAERLTEERDAALADAAALREQLEQARAQLLSSVARAEADVRHLQGRVDEGSQLLSKLRDEYVALEVRERAAIEQAATAKALVARLDDQLKDQKGRSADVLGKLEASKQRMESELMGVQRELRDAASALGQATGELEALRRQVAGQSEVIKGFAPAKSDGRPPVKQG